jgi:hypothetical protein
VKLLTTTSLFANGQFRVKRLNRRGQARARSDTNLYVQVRTALTALNFDSNALMYSHPVSLGPSKGMFMICKERQLYPNQTGSVESIP